MVYVDETRELGTVCSFEIHSAHHTSGSVNLNAGRTRSRTALHSVNRHRCPQSLGECLRHLLGQSRCCFLDLTASNAKLEGPKSTDSAILATSEVCGRQRAPVLVSECGADDGL